MQDMKDEHPTNTDELFTHAMAARQRAYVPYSGFRVGAVIRLENGQLITGCNVENASYGLTNCAERTAIFSMIAQGFRDVQEIAVVAEGDRPVAPCGACRQVMAEFCDAKTRVTLYNTAGQSLVTSVADLLPFAFSKEALQSE